MSEKIGRRKYLKYVGGAVVVAAVAAGGYGIYEYTKPKPERKITVLAVTSIEDVRVLRDLLPEFTERTGIKVEMPETDATTQTSRGLASFGLDVNSYDVMIINSWWTLPAWQGAGYLMPLDDFVEKDKYPDWSDFPPVVPGHTSWFEREPLHPGFKKAPITSYDPAKHETIGIPFTAETKTLMYRKDWFGAERMKPYETYEEIPTAAKALTKDEQGRSLNDPEHQDPVQWGFCFLDPNLLGYGFMESYAPAWGATVVDPDTFEPTCDTPEMIDALEWLHDVWESGVVPPGSPSLTFLDAIDYFKNSQVAAMEQWALNIRGIAEAPGWEEKLGWTVCPKSVKSGTTLACWSAVIPHNVADPEPAWEFIKWATSTETQKEIVEKVGIHSTGRYSIMKWDEHPWPEYRDFCLSALEGAVVPAIFPEYGGVVTAVIPPLTACAYEGKPAAESGAELNKIIRDILEEAGYYK